MARSIHGRVIIGIMLVLIGLATFVQNYEPFQNILPDFVYQWEVWFIVFGALFLFLGKNRIVGAVFMSIGLFNLFPEFWPLMFVVIGVYILVGHNRNKFFRSGQSTDSKDALSSEILEQVSIFGGGNKVVSSENFKGGSIISIFGGSEVNLFNSKLADGENILEVTSIFGGSTIIIPSDWKVEVDVLPIFGGYSDKRTYRPDQVFDPSKVLVIKGVAIFGGGEVKTIF